MKALYTIGYEGADLGRFISALTRHGVDYVLDVRERPSSRKRGFSKTPLREALARNGIRYHHERLLGGPRPLRDRLRRDGDYAGYFADFDRYLDTQIPLLEKLAKTLQGRVALLCFEHDINHCHRREVARALARLTGLQPEHLKPDEESPIRHHA